MYKKSFQVRNRQQRLESGDKATSWCQQSLLGFLVKAIQQGCQDYGLSRSLVLLMSLCQFCLLLHTWSKVMLNSVDPHQVCNELRQLWTSFFLNLKTTSPVLLSFGLKWIQVAILSLLRPYFRKFTQTVRHGSTSPRIHGDCMTTKS